MPIFMQRSYLNEKKIKQKSMRCYLNLNKKKSRWMGSLLWLHAKQANPYKKINVAQIESIKQSSHILGELSNQSFIIWAFEYNFGISPRLHPFYKHFYWAWAQKSAIISQVKLFIVYHLLLYSFFTIFFVGRQFYFMRNIQFQSLNGVCDQCIEHFFYD